MTELSERLASPISTVELERRWTAVRAAMEREGVDVLLMQNNNDHMGGYVKYFSDVPAGHGFPLTIVFPRDEPMTVVSHGPLGGDRELPAEGDGVLRGAGRVLSTASFASAPYSREYDARLACRALTPYAHAVIGLVGTFQMSSATVDAVRRELPAARFVEASELVDRIKMIKSSEEQELIRRTAALQDAAMDAAFGAVQPGKRDSDIAAVAQQVSQERGGEQGIYLCSSYTPGDPAQLNQRHAQDRVMRAGDVFNLLVESNGPGGFYTELGRTCVLGEAPPQLTEALQFTLEAQRHCLEMLRPGTPAREVWESYNAFMRDNGRPEENRLHCHGQGYDLVERPLIRHDETATIEAGMNITCHPTYQWQGITSWICDNYLITADGATESLHGFDTRIVEL